MVSAPHRVSVHQISNALTRSRFTQPHDQVATTACTFAESIEPYRNTSSAVKHIDMPEYSMFGQKLVDTLRTAESVILGGHIYGVVPYNDSRTVFSGEYLHINTTKYYDDKLRHKAVKSFVKQYAESNLRASISKAGCALAYCPANIKLVSVNGQQWYDSDKVLANSAVYIDYRVVQLPYTCQDRIITNCYNVLLGNPIANSDYIDGICTEYLFIKKI